MNRPGLWLTTVAATVSAISGHSQLPSSSCCASLNAYTPGRTSFSTLTSLKATLGVDPPLHTRGSIPARLSAVTAASSAFASSAAASDRPPAGA